jgi:hypothetical protein
MNWGTWYCGIGGSGGSGGGDDEGGGGGSCGVNCWLVVDILCWIESG